MARQARRGVIQDRTTQVNGTRGTPFTRRHVLMAGAMGLAALAAAGCSASDPPGQATGTGPAGGGPPEKTSLQVGSLKSVT
ncbi:MAG TPA: hypothetical protein VHF26_24210, partial [Trebonia sp.]|nr:hypothetical protein [Trebonia sp.]